MKKNSITVLSRIALMVAIYVLLSLTVAVRIGNWKLTFSSLPVVLSALLFGPAEGAVVAVMGEFLTQLLTYGIMPTTVLWIIPPAFRAVVIGLVAMRMQKKGLRLEEAPVRCYLVCVAAALVTTAGNTGGMVLDSMVYRTALSAVLVVTPLRIGTAVLTAIVVTAVAIPLARVLRDRGRMMASSGQPKRVVPGAGNNIVAKRRRG